MSAQNAAQITEVLCRTVFAATPCLYIARAGCHRWFLQCRKAEQGQHSNWIGAGLHSDTPNCVARPALPFYQCQTQHLHRASAGCYPVTCKCAGPHHGSWWCQWYSASILFNICRNTQPAGTCSTAKGIPAVTNCCLLNCVLTLSAAAVRMLMGQVPKHLPSRPFSLQGPQ